MPPAPLGSFETARVFAPPANRIRAQGARARSEFHPDPPPYATVASAAHALVAGDTNLFLHRLAGDPPGGSLLTLTRGLEAYQRRLALRIRYFGPVAPLDLSI